MLPRFFWEFFYYYIYHIGDLDFDFVISRRFVVVVTFDVVVDVAVVILTLPKYNIWYLFMMVAQYTLRTREGKYFFF